MAPCGGILFSLLFLLHKLFRLGFCNTFKDASAVKMFDGSAFDGAFRSV